MLIKGIAIYARLMRETKGAIAQLLRRLYIRLALSDAGLILAFCHIKHGVPSIIALYLPPKL